MRRTAAAAIVVILLIAFVAPLAIMSYFVPSAPTSPESTIPVSPSPTLHPPTDSPMATAGPQPNPERSSNYGVNVGELRDHIVGKVNARREAAGVGEMLHGSTLSRISQQHAERLAEAELLTHRLEGRSPIQRARAAGYGCRKDFGENLLRHKIERTLFGYNEGKIAEEIVKGWMGSLGHREQMLRGGWDRTGVGVAVAAQFTTATIYVAQNFASC